MKKEFVKYEQALALKEIGFDEPCLGYYFGKDEEVYLSNEDVKPPFTPSLDSKIMFRAPLIQQAFRWFREKDFGIIDKPFYSSLDEPKVTYALYIINWKTGQTYKMDRKKSYEEAEDACIDKVIKILKQ
jgi:hypothetical protein